MFDTIHQVTKSATIPYEKTIIEKKAPTDKSIELLNEFQEKAENNILYSVAIKDNLLSGYGIVITKLTHAFNEFKFICRFFLNGKEHIVNYCLNVDEINNCDELYKKILNEISNVIALKLLKEHIAFHASDFKLLEKSIHEYQKNY